MSDRISRICTMAAISERCDTEGRRFLYTYEIRDVLNDQPTESTSPMTPEEQHYIELGKAVEAAFEELGSTRITGFAPDDLVGLKSIEELLQWAKERERG